MDKSKILIIGCGGCGNNQLDTLMELDRRYTGIFMNTNLSEMENLKHFDKERRCFHVPNAEGTGKDRNLAEKYIKEDASKFAKSITNFINQSMIILMGSADGGTGSKAMIMLAKLIKKFCPDKSINIIPTFPNIGESDIAFQNTIDFWNELMELKNGKNGKGGIIDSIQFIDNNKGNEKEVNIKAMKELDRSFEIAEGKLDNSDSNRVHTSKGYKVILNLDERIRKTEDAIDKAISESMFYMPDNFECDDIIANINGELFDLNVIKDKFEYYNFNKFNTNGTRNEIVLGGCDIPTEAIELVKEALKEIKARKRNRVQKEDLIIKTPKIEKEDEETAISSSDITSKDLNDLFADDRFWDIF